MNNDIGQFPPPSNIVQSDAKQLNNSDYASVQALALVRTLLFTPSIRRKAVMVASDISAEMQILEICQKEGYNHVVIKGQKLNVAVDFKVWCGILRAISKYGHNSEDISLKFTEFARYCGYPSKKFNHELRKTIDKSLDRLNTQAISFQRKDKDVQSLHTGLILSDQLDTESDLIELKIDKRIWDLYRYDYQVLIANKIFNVIPRSEAAQCLYLYFTSLPETPLPISFKRLRERLQLTSSVKEANRTISNAINKLIEVGYLNCHILEKSDGRYVVITKRCQKLTLKNDGLSL